MGGPVTHFTFGSPSYCIKWSTLEVYASSSLSVCSDEHIQVQQYYPPVHDSYGLFPSLCLFAWVPPFLFRLHGSPSLSFSLLFPHRPSYRHTLSHTHKACCFKWVSAQIRLGSARKPRENSAWSPCAFHILRVGSSYSEGATLSGRAAVAVECARAPFHCQRHCCSPHEGVGILQSVM